MKHFKRIGQIPYMDNPRDIFLRLVRTKGNIQIDLMNNISIEIRDHILNVIFYVITDYIRYERETHESGFGPVEASYFCTDNFIDAVDARKWIRENIPDDDTSLVMYVFDNPNLMYRSKHRRTLLYLVNMLYFDL